MIRIHTDRLQSLAAAQQVQLGSGTCGAVANDEEHLMRTRRPTAPLRPGRLRRRPWHHTVALLLACGLLALAAPPAGAQAGSNEVQYSVSGPNSVTEGESAEFNVVLTGATTTAAVIFRYRIVSSGDNPADGADFTVGDAAYLQRGQRSIPKGDSELITRRPPIILEARRDGKSEGPETFTMMVTTASGGGAGITLVAGTTAVTTTIRASDPVTVAIADPAPATMEEGDTFRFPLTFGGGTPTGPITVNYTLFGTGISASDFDPEGLGTAGTPRTQIFAADDIMAARRADSPVPQTLSVAIVDDSDNEAAETFTVTLDPATGSASPFPVKLVSGETTAMATIAASDGVTVAIGPPGPGPVTESDTASVAFPLTFGGGTPTGPITVNYTLSGMVSSGVEQSDFAEEPSGGMRTPLTIALNAQSEIFTPAEIAGTPTLTILINNDDDNEGDETFTVTLRRPSIGQGVVSLGSATTETATIRDDAADTITVALVAQGTTVPEGDNVDLRLTITGGRPTRDVVVGYRISGEPGSGITAGDFATIVGGTRMPRTSLTGLSETFTPTAILASRVAGAAPLELPVLTYQDTTPESAEIFTVTLDTVTGVAGEVELPAAADPPPRITLVEDDVGILVNTLSETAGEGDTAVFTVTRRGDLRPEVALTYRVDGDGIDAADYEDLTDTEPLGTIILERDQASAEIRIRIESNEMSEPDEMLRVTVAEARPPALSAGGTFAILTASAEVRILRLEITVALLGPAEVPEGETAVFAVSLGLEPRRSVTTSEVRIAYTLGAPEVDTAQRGDDYQSSPGGQGTLRIPAGSTEGVIEVPVLRDGLLEAVEVFSLALAPGRSSGGGGSIRFAEVRQLAVRILDNADQEARREQRTRAMLAATHRAAAQMATDVISNRFSHRNVRAQSPGDLEASNGTASLGVGVANQGSPAAKRGPQARAEGPGAQRGVASRSRAESCSGRERTAEAFGRCAPAGSHNAAERSLAVDVNTQREPAPGALRRAGTAPDASSPGSSFATDALSTALRLTGLPTGPTASTGAGADVALQDPESAALLAGIDVPVRPFETDPYAVGSSGAPSTDASATDLGDALDPRLPSFAELLRGGHQFELSGEQAGFGGFGEGLSLWGAGTFQSLAGEPELDGRRLDYNGESFGVFLGADKRLALSGDGSELLAGAALGWTRGDLDYRDEALEVFELEGRFESKLWSIHPYASLRFSPRAQLWLIAGYGWGDAKIEERETREGERTATRRVETDATLWMVSAGAEGSVPLGSEASLLTARLQGTRTGGELDSARFGDGARLRGTRARTWRVAGELEVSHRFAFAEGGQFRPFATLRVRGDAGDDRQDDWEFAVDLGGGAELLWPERGLSLGLEGTAQLNQLQEYQEHRVTVDLSYDLAGDGRGLTVAVGSTLEGSGRLGDRIDGRSGLSAGSAFATAPYAPPGAAPLGALLPGSAGRDDTAGRELGALRHSLQGEIGYGLAVLPFWSPGLLTPYARFELAGRGASAYATGLRFEAATGARLGMELGVDFDRRSATPPPDYQFLLTGELDF